MFFVLDGLDLNNFPELERDSGWSHEKLALQRRSVHPGLIARVPPLRTRRPLSPPCEGGVWGGGPGKINYRVSNGLGGNGNRLGNRVGRLGPCKIRLRTVSTHTENCPVHPPWPPLRKGGKGVCSPSRHLLKEACAYANSFAFRLPAPAQKNHNTNVLTNNSVKIHFSSTQPHSPRARESHGAGGFQVWPQPIPPRSLTAHPRSRQRRPRGRDHSALHGHSVLRSARRPAASPR